MNQRSRNLRIFGVYLGLFLAILSFPGTALASGGGPILVLFCLSTFLPALVPIVLIEALVYWRCTRFAFRSVLHDVGIANLASFLLVFVVAPVVIAAFGLISTLLPPPIGDVIFALSTWVYDATAYFDLAVVMTFVWLLVLGVLAVLVEARLFGIFWARRHEPLKISAIRTSILCNVPTTALALIAGGLLWRELF